MDALRRREGSAGALQEEQWVQRPGERALVAQVHVSGAGVLGPSRHRHSDTLQSPQSEQMDHTCVCDSTSLMDEETKFTGGHALKMRVDGRRADAASSAATAACGGLQ